jgi:nitrogen fixation protein FixH
MTDETQPRPSDKYIPWYIVLFFVVLTGVFGGFAYIANKTYTGVVTDEAYTKGLEYNSVIKKAEKQDNLGFSSTLEHKNGKIIFTLKDKQGQGVAAGKVKLFLFRPVQDGSDYSQEMSKTASGTYTATVTPPQKGQWEVRVHADTAQGSYQTAQRIVFE